MILSSGIRGGAGRLLRAVAHVVAAALAVTAMVAAICTGPVASASADARPRAASPSPARVKFYVVPPPGNGHAESLFTIAAETLGDGGEYMEIFSLNKGRLQPNGGRLTNPRIIEPGWILQLPADAAGPGVHFGPLPVVTPTVSHRPSRPGGTGSAIVISGVLLAFVVTGLTVRLIRRRAGRGLRRRPMHARTPGPRATYGAGRSPTTRLTRPKPDQGWQLSRDCDPGRPPPDDDRPGWPHPRDPSPGWQSPADGSGPPPTPAPPQQAPVRPGSPAALRYPPAILTAGIQWRAARPTRTPGPSPQTYFDVNRLQVAVTEPPAYDWEGARSPAGRERSAWLVNLTLPDADHQAAEIRHQTSAAQSATPAAKPPGRPRQFRAMRLAVLAMTIPILFGLVAATTELALHGYGYFVFRSAGTGATQQEPSESSLSQPPTAHHRRRHVGRPSQDGPPCGSSLGSGTARAIRTN
jgi:hypothetical protein